MRKHRVMFLALAFALTGLLVANCSGTSDYADTSKEIVSVPSEVSIFGPTAEEIKLSRLALHSMLTEKSVALGASNPLVLDMSKDELRGIALQELAQRDVFPGPKLVGVVRDVNQVIDLSALQRAALSANSQPVGFGAVHAGNEGNFAWTALVESKGATAIRVHFAEMNLPEGMGLYIYNDAGEAYGPFFGTGPNRTGQFWTPSVAGSKAFLQLHGSVTERASLASRLVVDMIVHVDPKGLNPDAVEQYNFGTQCYGAECTKNADCYNVGHMGGAEAAIAHYQYIKRPYYYMCTGGLLADSDPGSEVPYFLTANHCVSKQRYADTAEFFFDYTSACGSTCGDAEATAVKVGGGATLLSTNSTSDYSLMRLNNTPPSGRTYLGWSTAALAYNDGAALFRLAHPAGGPLSYSEHVVDTGKGTCSSWPRGDWIYSTDILGATEGGSSGSPVLNASAQVVGQLSGGCGTNVYDECDTVSNATVDGAFASYYGAVSGWLGEGLSGCTGDGDCAGGELCCDGSCVAPACGADAECDDGDSCTTDSCLNPGSCTAACEQAPVADGTACGIGGICCGGSCSSPACSADADCDDSETCTADTCLNAGTCSASCDSSWPACGLADGCCGPDCSHANDADCSAPDPCGDGYCAGSAAGEDCYTCPLDCPMVGNPRKPKACCGDGECTAKYESAATCPVDCQ